MTRIRLRAGLVFGLFAGMLAAGCGAAVEGVKQATEEASQAAATAGTREQLMVLGQAFHKHDVVHRQFPPDWDALIEFQRQDGGDVEALTQLRDAGCVVNGWGLELRDVTVGLTNFALAYLPKATQEGGLVLHADGAVVHISAEELQRKLENQRDM